MTQNNITINDKNSQTKETTMSRSKYKDLDNFSSTLKHPLDPFQEEACRSVVEGKTILVGAPTGAGKTIIGEFGVFSALQHGGKAFYTTPIKALSNQKYKDFCKQYGSENVGLLTGDTSINSEAPIVIMTTEVLRNMIYANSKTLHNLKYVIMDEVHYLGDKFRGAVWEEVLIHLPDSVTLIALSATVSNIEEFGAWIESLRADTDIVVSEHRPVPLTQHVMVDQNIEPLYSSDTLSEYTQLTDSGAPDLNATLVKVVKTKEGQEKRGSGNNFSRNSHGRRKNFGRPETLYKKPTSPEIIKVLEDHHLLPAIDFIFSRKGCEIAVEQCLESDLVLTTPGQRVKIEQVLDRLQEEINPTDYDILNYWNFCDGLLRGFGAHHAGMLPLFKETVEKLFSEGLIQVVFSTETLALGINMPARTVVIEKMSKFNGEKVLPLTPGEFTQLTGRAGRRGIDTEGHAVVLWEPELDIEQLSSMVSSRSYPLYSSFKPSYNMTINLISEYGEKTARDILESSFAQFQANLSTAEWSKEVEELNTSLKGYDGAIDCEYGDVKQYAKLRRDLNQAEKKLSMIRRDTKKLAAKVEKNKKTQGRSQKKSQNIIPAQAQIQRNVKRINRDRRKVDQLKNQLANHSVAQCPDRESHMRWMSRYNKLASRRDNLQRRIDRTTNSISKAFDKTCSILQTFGYLRINNEGSLVPTDKGDQLKTLYGDRDLLISLCLEAGLLNKVNVEELAGILSTFVYEARLDENFTFEAPSEIMARSLESEYEVWDRLETTEDHAHITSTAMPELGMVWPMYKWVAGKSLSETLKGTDLTAGDFARWSKQVVDVCDQITKTTGVSDNLKHKLNAVIDSTKRGILLYSENIEEIDS